MRLAIALLTALLAATGAAAQNRGGIYRSPFTGYEAQALTDVWLDIREAPSWEAINWRAHGLNRAPGSPEAQQIMAANWDELRREEYFEHIEWDEILGEDRGRRSRRSDQVDRFERQFPGTSPFSDVGPFTRDEAVVLSQLWPEIREAARYEDINWQAHGVEPPPGDSSARRIMATNWNELRQESRFEDIDWDELLDERELRSRERQYAGGYTTTTANPFTPEEAAVMSRVWGRIREAGSFDDIDWRSLGLSGAPGDREARRIMATHWGQLREAARFEDINWAATRGGVRRRG